MEKVCFQENEQQFSQSELTPPMVEPIIFKLGFLGNNMKVELIFDGPYETPPGTNQYLLELLASSRVPTKVRDIIMTKDSLIPIYLQKPIWMHERKGSSVHQTIRPLP